MTGDNTEREPRRDEAEEKNENNHNHKKSRWEVNIYIYKYIFVASSLVVRTLSSAPGQLRPYIFIYIYEAFTIVVGTTKETLFSFDLRHMTLHSHLFKKMKFRRIEC